MRVVITGGTGLIGRRLAAELASRGDAAVVTSRRPGRVRDLAADVEVAGWDGISPAALAPTLEGADAVVHLVGESIAGGRWTAARKRRIEESRTRSTAALVAALGALEQPPPVLVQGSAVGYYGGRGDESLVETSAAGSGFLADVCRAWEAAGEPAEALGVRRIVVRTGVVLSDQGGALPKMALPFRFFAGGPVGGGDQWVPWIHIDDEVGAIRFLLGLPAARGPYNLAAPGVVTNAELSREIGRALGRPSFVPAPAFAMRLVLGEMAELLLGSQRVEPAALIDAGYSFRHPALAPALADLLG